MGFELSAVLNIVLAIVVLISLVRLRKINQAFLPFIILLWVGLAIEIISFFLIRANRSNAVPGNFYNLIEIQLIIWQFQKWKLLNSKTVLILFSLFTIFWLIENLFISSIYTFNSYALIIFSVAVIFLSINYINRLLLTEDESLIKNPRFIICLAFTFYFTYTVFVEAFWAYGFGENLIFATNIYTILLYVNLLTNLMYTIAILWIPTRPNFLLPSSSRQL
jgi:hypothetical protein